MDASEYFKSLELKNHRRKEKQNVNENVTHNYGTMNPPNIITIDDEDDEIIILDNAQKAQPSQSKQSQNITPIRREQNRLNKQKSRASMSQEAIAASREADRLRKFKAKAASKTPDQIPPVKRSLSQNSLASTPKRKVSLTKFQTFANFSNNASPLISKKRTNFQMSKSQGDLIFDTLLQQTPKRRTSTQFLMKNSQTNFSNSLQFQNPIKISPVTPQPLKFSPSLFNPTFEEESQSNQNQITKWINENIDFVKVYLNLEDNGIFALQSILSETEKIQFQNSNNEEKENMLKFRKSETCKFIHSLIQNLIGNMEIEAIKQIIFEKKIESEALLITSFIFDGIQNVQNIDDIQIATLISTVRLYIKKAKSISKMAFEETSTIRESLKRLLNKQIVGIPETDDYENRRILGFAFHTVNRTEHVTIGQPIRDLFPQVYDNFMTLNAATNDHIFVHLGKRIVNVQEQNINFNGTSQNLISPAAISKSQSTKNSQNSISNVTIGNSQINEILIESIPNSQISDFLNGTKTYSQNIGNNFVGNSQNSILTATVPNSQTKLNQSIQDSSQASSNSQSSNNSQTLNSSQEFFKTDIMHSEGFKSRREAETYINATRGYLCSHGCPAISADFSKQLIPYLQDLAYANSFNIFHVLKDFETKCLQRILLHAPCFQGLRTIKRYYDDLNRHVKIISSVNKIFHERKFKDLENFVNNQKLPKEIAAELYTKFLPKVSDFTEPMGYEKFGGLMEKFLKEDQNIAASNCQICQQIFKASALMKIKYENIEKFCSDAICEELIQIHPPEILICKPCWTDIKKKSLPRMATTNEMGVTALNGILKTLTKLEWTLLKPIRISQTIFNIYPNENNYEMVDAINSVENGKPIFITSLPSMTTIKIYIYGKIDNLKAIICRQKLLKAFEILKEINPFYSEIQYNPNFEFTDDSVSFQRKGQNPDYRILIDEYEENENVANVDFYGINQDLNPMQQGTVLNRFLKRKHLHFYINSTATNHEVSCFPNMFPDGKFGRTVETRKKPISDTLWIKNRVNHISRQFLDPEFLMFLKSFKDTKALFGAVSITFREINGVINVTDLIQTFQQDRYSVVMDSALTTKFRALRGSNDYFNEMENDLQCVADTIGPASFFVTANPSPKDWQNLKRTYLKIYNNISVFDYDCDKMIAKDPVIFATYFRNKLNNLLHNFILAKNGPFGELIHHFFRIDYQESNLTHAHMIFWSKNETTFKKLGEKKCIELIDRVVSCRIPDPISESFAYDSVMKFQKHSNKCSKSCLVKTMDGENFECRYGFPKFSREYTKLNLKNGELFADKSMGWREYDLRRNENEELIGDYNLPLLLVWQGNINVQVLISGNISNLIKYLTKPMSAKALAESCKINNRITKNLSVSAVAAIGSQFLKNKPYGLIECVDHLLNYPLSGSSFNVRFINTNPPEKRQKTLATNIEPENLTPENVYQATMLDNYLPNRDEFLQSFCYYNIAANFNIVRRKSSETKSEEDDQNAENMDDENFTNDTDDLEITYSSLPSQSSQFSQLFELSALSQSTSPSSSTSNHSSQSVPSTLNPSQSSQLLHFSELSALSQSISSSNPSQEDIKNQQKYGGNAFLNADYSIFNEKSPTFCHLKIKVGTLIKSGYKDVYFFKRAKPVIPRFYLPYFDESNFLKANDYFRRLCVMFIPFNKEDDLKSDEDGYITKFMDFYDNLLITNKDAADDILRITKNFGERLQLQFEAAKKLENETIPEKEALGIEEIDESEDTSKQLAWLKVSEIDEIITTISQQENSNASQTTKQIITFISGVAGTGKSHLIKALSQYLILHYTNSTDDGYSAPAVIIGAPTAYAASALAIGANTIHSIFGLVDILSKYKPMTSEIASENKVLFDNCKLIIIDEISMCSNVILMEINLRCQEITGNKKLFGGMNFVAFGDLLQLPPIKSLQVFEPLTATQVYSKFVGGVGLNLWEEFEYHELTENMRQKNAQIYSKALERLRIGESTEADIQMFKSRIIPAAKDGEIPTFMEMAKYYLNLCEKGGNVMAIFSKVDDVNMFNNAVMECRNLNIIDIFAKSSKKKSEQNFHQPWKQSCFDKTKISKFINLPKSDQSVIEQYPNQKTKLPNLIRIAIGCRIILKRNLDMSKGLINGALGTLRDIKSHEIPSTKNNGFERVVDKLLIEFDHALGEIFEISRDTVTFKNFKGIQNSQSQFPMAVAFSCTIHKGQGASLDTVMVSLKDIFEGGQAYVALSRVKTLEGLHISVWDQSSFKVNTKAILEYNRLRATIGLPAFNVPGQDEIIPFENDETIFQGNGKMPILKLFNSNDRQNCINSTIQILRKIPEFLQWIQNHIFQENILFKEMKEIFEYIGKDEIANTEKFGATIFSLNEEIMYDPEKLIEMILAQSDDEIKSLWQFKKTILAKCRICNLEYEIPTNSFTILKLVLPQSLPKLPFEELLNFNEAFQQIRPCLMCTQTAPQQIRNTLAWPDQCQSKYLFISLDPCNRQQSKAVLKITNHLTKRQKIGGKLWDLIGAIEHNGASKFSGSYIPWLSDERREERKTFWHKISDDKSFEICNFSDLSKDVILLYKKHCK